MRSPGVLGPLASLALLTLVACGTSSDDIGRSDDGVVDGGPEVTHDLVAERAEDEDELIASGVATCNPIAPEWDCLLPFPSDVFLVPDPSLPSGRRLAITGAARLTREDGVAIAPYERHLADGFSHYPPILALFPGGVDPTNLVFHTDDLSKSTGSSSPTVLLDAASGRAVPHFAELDPMADDEARRALLIRPLARLENATRYIVAVHGLRDLHGALVAPPEGFRRIRDQEASNDAVLDALAERYEVEVFPALEARGVQRETLQLAWDFTTETAQSVTRDMLHMREDLIARLNEAPPDVTVTAVVDDVDERVFRHVEATMRVPLYVSSDQPGAVLTRDEHGEVNATGYADVPFLLRIPRSLEHWTPDQPPARVLQYGHGFFNGRDEMDASWLMEFAERYRFVVVATDWWGMTGLDLPPLIDALTTDPSRMMEFSDRLHQGMANFIALTYAVAGPLRRIPELQFGGATVYDPDQIGFYGWSQGGVLGGTYLPLAPRIQRGVLSASGASFAFMMPRSRNFRPFFMLMKTSTPDPLDIQKWVALLATSFDRIDPVTYAGHTIHDRYPGGPSERRVLIQGAVGDTEVPDLAGQLMARTMGVDHLQPASREIAGLTQVEAPHPGSAMVEFGFGIEEPLPGTWAVPPMTDNGVHHDLPRVQAGMQQIDAFLQPTGQIEHFCDGVCDPE